ncbi:MAG: 4-hydroxyphenylacetate 3-hydroxylase, partial [Alphaproteobacteria bacterium]|nr:4-hydroxyphenylacetate 3-hydroxylase [Alphaproteobacteria bacterium]
MLRTGDQYRDSIRDGRAVWIDGERVADVTRHPAFKPIVDARARMYDMAHETAHRAVMTYEAGGESFSRATKPPTTQQDWHEKRAWVDTVLRDLGGVVIRVGDETVGEMWSLYDGRVVLNEIDPRFGSNIARHIERAHARDVFHVSANTDPKGDRSK